MTTLYAQGVRFKRLNSDRWEHGIALVRNPGEYSVITAFDEKGLKVKAVKDYDFIANSGVASSREIGST